MANIHIESLGGNRYAVTANTDQTTTHEVTLDPAYREQLVGEAWPPEKLIEKSFEFLLQRESNTSILRKFDLPLIKSYFPEYEDEIRKQL